MPLAALEEVREQLIAKVNADLIAAEREFLLSLKMMQPKWELLGLPGPFLALAPDRRRS